MYWLQNLKGFCEVTLLSAFLKAGINGYAPLPSDSKSAALLIMLNPRNCLDFIDAKPSLSMSKKGGLRRDFYISDIAREDLHF